ncbi:sensor histidine kinase [Olsenella massiliensis]|uniref:sensor histidine kinase n=1 Tax=Olsenella massiliensis TaxID=1622075 RepID=UPI00071C65C3|nr:sensor histidine kinase [Olsenella massiliensis]
MTWGEWLQDHVVQVVAWLVPSAFACCVCALVGLGASVVALVALSLALGGAVAAVTSRWADARFLTALLQLPRSLEHAWQLATLVPDPQSNRAALVYDALQAMGASAASDVEAERRASREYREYVEGWIHEVKAPITAATLAAGRQGADGPDAVRRELSRVSRLVDQALWYARVGSVAADYVIRDTRLADLCRASCKAEARLLIERGVTPELLVPEKLVVPTDAKWVGFVLSQVVVNAAKYGATHLRFSARVTDGPSGGRLTELCVADDGRGIPARDLPRIFDRGFTGENGRAGEGSTGMGLYLAARICERMGLVLEVASEKGEGTRVLVGFPHDADRLALADTSFDFLTTS